MSSCDNAYTRVNRQVDPAKRHKNNIAKRNPFMSVDYTQSGELDPKPSPLIIQTLAGSSDGAPVPYAANRRGCAANRALKLTKGMPKSHNANAEIRGAGMVKYARVARWCRGYLSYRKKRQLHNGCRKRYSFLRC